MKHYTKKLYIVTNNSKQLKRLYFYEFTNKKEALKFFNSEFCKNTEWNEYSFITIDGKPKKAQSIKYDI